MQKYLSQVFELVQKTARAGNLVYDGVALPKNVPAFATLMYPELIRHISPRVYLWTIEVLNKNRLAHLGKEALELYFGTMIAMTFARLAYFGITKKMPPSLPEYPRVATDAFRTCISCVQKATKRIVCTIGTQCNAEHNNML